MRPPEGTRNPETSQVSLQTRDQRDSRFSRIFENFFSFSLPVFDLEHFQFHFHFSKKSEGISFFTFHFSKKSKSYPNFTFFSLEKKSEIRCQVSIILFLLDQSSIIVYRLPLSLTYSSLANIVETWQMWLWLLKKKEWKHFVFICTFKKRVKTFCFHFALFEKEWRLLFSLLELPRPSLAGACFFVVLQTTKNKGDTKTRGSRSFGWILRISKQIWGNVIIRHDFIKEKIYLTLQLNLLVYIQSTWRRQLHEACSKCQLEWITLFSV